MKLTDHLVDQARGSVVNQEIIRARAVTAELKVNIKKANGTHAHRKEFDYRSQSNAGTN